MKDKYYYFVSYMTNGKVFGIGNIQVTIDREIESIDDIREIEKYIKENTNSKNATILNYIKFRKG